jgi:hypothetical protein
MTYAVEYHRNCQKAHCHDMTVIPPKDEKPYINAEGDAPGTNNDQFMLFDLCDLEK